jgi:DNA polymerase-1
MSNKRLFLVDATAFCYRAFFALPSLSTSFGQPTNAIYGFINILNKILKEQKPDYLAVCFDVSRDTFRLKKFAEYKIHRPPMPDGLSSQIPLIKEIVRAFGISVFEKQGFEADDIIATFARKAKEKKLSVTIISSDKDILQLVDDTTIVFSPYKDEGIFYDQKKVIERYKVKSEKIPDIIALMGDQADNIPGISGIGEKTATELIGNFGSLDNLLHNLDKIKQERLRKSISDNIDKINLNRELVVLDRNLDIDFGLEELTISEPDTKELFRLFKYLEFKKLLKGLPAEHQESRDVKLETLKDVDLEKEIRKSDELAIYGDSADSLVCYSMNKFFKAEGSGKNLRDALSNPGLKKISHDLKKIKVSLYKDNIVLAGLYFDTMIAAYLLNASKGQYGLADISFDYLGTSLGESITDNKRAIDLIVQLKPRLEKELHEKSLYKLFSEIEMPLVEVLAQMELSGIKLDLKVLEKLSQDIEKRLIKLISEIYDISGCEFNINSPKQLRQILFEKLKLPVIKRSKTGPSTDEEVLRNLSGRHKLPELLLLYRQLTKIKNTYVDTLPGLIDQKTGMIHTSFNQTGTETGRLSSSNPNLQNIPIRTEIGRNIRRAVIASNEKNYLLSCDYSQIELRILAHLSKDENLILAFKNNLDIHKATAALIFTVEESQVTDEMREAAKRVNFGIVYGLTAYGLSKDLGIAVNEAQDFIDTYFLRYPKVKEYIEAQIRIAEKSGFVTTIFGRRRYIPEIVNKNQNIRQFAERQAVNTPIQGSASDLIKLAMIDIYNHIKQRHLESKMVLQIHDELVFDMPLKEQQELVVLVRNRMENVLTLEVPIRVDIKLGRNWLEMEEIR